MAATTGQPDLWSLVRGTPWIDPETLLTAIERESRQWPHDFRTRGLLRDSAVALGKRWGSNKLAARLSDDARSLLERIAAENLGEPGFPTLEQRMVDATTPETIREFLREMGAAVHQPICLEI